jgi:hypothetical protein
VSSSPLLASWWEVEGGLEGGWCGVMTDARERSEKAIESEEGWRTIGLVCCGVGCAEESSASLSANVS